MNCVVCGKELHGKQRQYCSRACEGKARRAREKEVHKRVCKYCGAEFEAKSAKRIFCSDDCKQRYHRPASIKRQREKREAEKAAIRAGLPLPQTEAHQPREITPTTVYLVHKWTAEGMPVGVIAQTLERCAEDVNRALSQPITEEQAAPIREHFVRYKPRRAEE